MHVCAGRPFDWWNAYIPGWRPPRQAGPPHTSAVSCKLRYTFTIAVFTRLPRAAPAQLPPREAQKAGFCCEFFLATHLLDGSSNKLRSRPFIFCVCVCVVPKLLLFFLPCMFWFCCWKRGAGAPIFCRLFCTAPGCFQGNKGVVCLGQPACLVGPFHYPKITPIGGMIQWGAPKRPLQVFGTWLGTCGRKKKKKTAFG